MAGSCDHALDSARRSSSSSWARIVSTPTASLSWKTSPARIDSTIAGVPPSSRCAGSVEVAVVLGVDVRDRAAAGHVRAPGWSAARVARRARRACDGPADELVRREEDRRPCSRAGRRRRGRPSRSRRRARRPRSPRRTARRAVQQRRDAGGVGDDAGDVARRRRSEPILSGRSACATSSASSTSPGRCARRRPRDRDDVGDRLAPRDLVGVVLEGAEEHHRSLARAGCASLRW